MAAKFFTGIDLCNQELLRARFQNLSTAPTIYAAGMMYYDNSTTNNTKGRVVLRSISDWQALAFLSDLDAYTPLTTYNGLSDTVGGIDTRLKAVETIFEADSDGTINKWNEVVAFLSGIDGDNLDTILDTFATKATSFTAGTGLTGTLKLDGTGTFSLATVGKEGTYYKVTTDAYGRVTSGVTSLAITDVTNLQTTIEGLTDGINDNSSAISTLQGYFTNGVAKNADKLDGNDSAYFATAASVTELGKRVKANEDAISGINTTLGSHTSTLSEHTTAITTLGNRVNPIEVWYESVGKYFKKDSEGVWYVDGNFYTKGQNAAGGIGEADGGGSGIVLDYDSIIGALGYTPLQSSDLAPYLESAAASGIYATITTVDELTDRVDELENKATSVSYVASTASSAVIGSLTIDGTASNISLRAVNVTSALGYTPTKKVTGTITANGAATQTITHNLNTRDVIVQIFEPSSPYELIYADVKATSTTQVQITFAEAPTKAYKVVIIG